MEEAFRPEKPSASRRFPLTTIPAPGTFPVSPLPADAAKRRDGARLDFRLAPFDNKANKPQNLSENSPYGACGLRNLSQPDG
jgi:hypothetical protein